MSYTISFDSPWLSLSSCGCIQMSLVLGCDAVRTSLCLSLCPSLFVVLPVSVVAARRLPR